MKSEAIVANVLVPLTKKELHKQLRMPCVLSMSLVQIENQLIPMMV